MREEIVDIATADGAMETFICRPERGGPFPPVLFLMDAPGIREELHDMARRLATVGYFVLLRTSTTGPDATRSTAPTCSCPRAPTTRGCWPCAGR